MTITAEAPAELREALRSKDLEGRRWYAYPPTAESFISVTAVLDETEGKRYLIGWAGRRSARRCVDSLPLIAQMLAGKGRAATLKYLAEDAERDRQVKADTGTYVHDVVESLVLWAASPDGTGEEITWPSLPEHLEGAEYEDATGDQPALMVADVAEWMTQGFLNWVSDWTPQFEAAEMPVFLVSQKAAGTLDLIVILAGYAIDRERNILAPCPGSVLTVCLDVKTGKHQSPTWREQVAAYRRAEECIPDPTSGLVPMPATDCAAVLHLRPEYPRGYRMMLVAGDDDEAAWGTFRTALATFRDRHAAKAKPGKVVYPLRADGTIPAPLLADLDGEGVGRVIGPLMKAGIPDLEVLAAMTAVQCRALPGVGAKTVDGIRGLLAGYGLALAGEQGGPVAS